MGHWLPNWQVTTLVQAAAGSRREQTGTLTKVLKSPVFARGGFSMPSPDLVALGKETIKRIKNQGLLFAIALFIIAMLACVALIRQPTVPWWAQVGVMVFVLAVVLFI